jgi:hypothetical protein
MNQAVWSIADLALYDTLIYIKKTNIVAIDVYVYIYV